MTDTLETWLQISFKIETRSLEEAESTLLNIGALSVTLKDAGDQPLLEPLPGETPLWDHCIVTALFAANTTDQDLLLSLLHTQLEHLNLDQLQVEIIKNQVWERAWMDAFKPIRFGKRLWICPSHHAPPEPDAINLKLDPGLAFGTGSHPTTALCLEWLDAQNLHGKTLIDYGCGSGILSIAAILLGAERVIAIDLDPQALEATKANAAANSALDRIDIRGTSTPITGTADIVIANILTNTLIELANTLHDRTRTRGKIALSGILSEQTSAIQTAYAQGFNLQPPRCKDGWVLLAGQKRP